MRLILLCIGLLSNVTHAYEILVLDVEGVERTARVFPGTQATNSASPLVLAFHGRGDSEFAFARAVGLHRDWPEATVVYPRGIAVEAENAMRGWRTRAGGHEGGELALVDGLIAELSDRYRVDPERIFVTGFSNGGRLVFELIEARPCLFAAFAPVGAVSRAPQRATVSRPVIYLFGSGESRQYEQAWATTVVGLTRLNRVSGAVSVWAGDYKLARHEPDGAPVVWGLYPAGHIWPHAGNALIRGFFEEFGAPCAARVDQ